LTAYGVGGTGSGGSLSIKVPTIQIGGTSSDANTLVLSPDFFNQGGFSTFSLTAATSVTVTSNTVVEPSVQSYQPVLTSNAGSLALVPVTLPAVQQSPVSLTLNATSVRGADGGIAVDGSAVVAAGASIVLNPTARGTGSVVIGTGVGLAAVGVLGSIIVPGGKISIATDGAVGGITINLAPGSVLSTAGTLVPTLNAYGSPAGTVLPGGSITLTGGILAEPGAVVDVSGASGTIYQSSSLGRQPGGHSNAISHRTSKYVDAHHIIPRQRRLHGERRPSAERLETDDCLRDHS
jgi:hypothetical protein